MADSRAIAKHDQLMAVHHDLYTSWTALVTGLGADDWGRPTGCPGWDVADNVAHVIGVERACLGDPEPAHDLPDGLDHVRDAFGAYMEVHVDARRGTPPAELVAELELVIARRLEALAAIGPDDLDEPVAGPMGMQAPAVQLLGIRAFDMWIHEQDVRRAVGRPGPLDAPAAQYGLGRMQKGIVRSLPERIDGTGRVEIRVAGLEGGDVAFTLDVGEAAVAPIGAPDATMTFDAAGFVAWGAGRADAPTLADLEVVGDRALAAAVHGAGGITP